MRFPLLAKVAALGGVTMLLLMSLWHVEGVLHERRSTQQVAESGLQDSLANPQVAIGPVLQLRCTETWERTEGEGKDRKTVTESAPHLLNVWPRSLLVDASASIEPRYRGIFKLNGYLTKHAVQARFEMPALPQPAPGRAGARMQCGVPVIGMALSDARGIRGAQVKVGHDALPVQPGSLLATQAHGFHAALPPAAAGSALDVQLTLELAGTRSLGWVPVGEDTRVQLSSPWPHPSFGGRFLPVEREVTSQGFRARWQVSALATTAQDALARGGALCAMAEDGLHTGGDTATGPRGSPCVDTFAVGFIDPVNGYLLNERAVKYGLLFIVLTFVAVGLVEVLRRLRVHPIQYLLVGSALTVFFLLLLSLSEHLPFGQAYLAAAAACTALLAYYGGHVLRGAKAGFAFGAGIGTLYAALYALLQLEQTALVLGSLLLFAVLASVMVATRRIDWYALMAQMRSDAAPRAAAAT